MRADRARRPARLRAGAGAAAGADATARAGLHRLRAHPARLRARPQPRGRAPGADQPHRVRARGRAQRRAARAAGVRAARRARARDTVAARGVRRGGVDGAIARDGRVPAQRAHRRGATPASGERRSRGRARRAASPAVEAVGAIAILRAASLLGWRDSLWHDRPDLGLRLEDAATPRFAEAVLAEERAITSGLDGAGAAIAELPSRLRPAARYALLTAAELARRAAANPRVTTAPRLSFARRLALMVRARLGV